jgi:Penicillin amidase
MLTIQNDTVDLMARDIVPSVRTLVLDTIPALSPLDGEKAQDLVGRLATWYGSMDEISVGATIFSTWQFFFYKTLMNEQIKDDSLRLALVGNYPFIDYV